MSTNENFEWLLGDLWSLVVDCNDGAGADLTPIQSAVFSLKTYEGVQVLVVTNTGSNILIEAPLVTTSVDSNDEEIVDPEIFHDGALFLGKLRVTSNGAASTQWDGVIIIGDR